MLVELSWCVVRIKDDASKMTIISPSAEENGVFYPSQDINIYGQKDIKELRDALIEVCPLEE